MPVRPFDLCLAKILSVLKSTACTPSSAPLNRDICYHWCSCAALDEVKAAILLFYGLLDDQQRRLFAGLESIRLGYGGDTLLGDFLGLDTSFKTLLISTKAILPCAAFNVPEPHSRWPVFR
jgi:hypothetical protein